MIMPTRNEFCGRLSGPKAKVSDAAVRFYVSCPACCLEIIPSEEKPYWEVADLQRVGMFKMFDCPHCVVRLQLPFDLFTLHHESEPAHEPVVKRRARRRA